MQQNQTLAITFLQGPILILVPERVSWSSIRTLRYTRLAST